MPSPLTKASAKMCESICLSIYLPAGLFVANIISISYHPASTVISRWKTCLLPIPRCLYSLFGSMAALAAAIVQPSRTKTRARCQQLCMKASLLQLAVIALPRLGILPGRRRWPRL